MAETQPAKLEYRGLILPFDGLRGAGVLAVILAHGFYDSPYKAAPGSAAQYFLRLTLFGGPMVIVFFALSGFLITGILLDSVDRPRYWQNFYIRRALRILPAYMLLLAALKLGHFVSSRFVLAAFFYIANMARLVGAHAQEYGVLWTLAVEEQFYLVWPVFVRYLSRGRLLALIVAALLLTPLFRLLLATHGVESYLNTPSNVDCIVSGALLAILLRNGTIHRGNIRPIYLAIAALSVLGFAPVLYDGLRGINVDRSVLLAAFNKIPMYGFFAAFALWIIARRRRDAPPPGPTLRFLLFFGDISYGLYLVHQLVFLLYDRYTAGTALAGFDRSFGLLTVRCLLVTLVATAIAWVSRRYFEDLFLKQKTKLAPYKGDPNKVSDPRPGVLPGTEERS